MWHCFGRMKGKNMYGVLVDGDNSALNTTHSACARAAIGSLSCLLLLGSVSQVVPKILSQELLVPPSQPPKFTSRVRKLMGRPDMRWHSSAMPRNTIQVNGGVQQVHGEFVLAPGAERSRMNMADWNTSCTLQDMSIQVLSKYQKERVRPSAANPMDWVAHLQNSPAAQRALFHNRSAISFYREMASGLCNPSTMGSTLRVGGITVTGRGFGRGLHQAVAGQQATFSLLLEFESALPIKTLGMVEGVSVGARLVGPSLLAVVQVNAEFRDLHSSSDARHKRLKIDFSYIATEPGQSMSWHVPMRAACMRSLRRSISSPLPFTWLCTSSGRSTLSAHPHPPSVVSDPPAPP